HIPASPTNLRCQHSLGTGRGPGSGLAPGSGTPIGYHCATGFVSTHLVGTQVYSGGSMKTKIRAAAIAAAVCSSLMCAQSHFAAPAGELPGTVQSKDFNRTVDLEAGGSLVVNSDKGSVHLTAWDRNQVEISARIDPPTNVDADYGRRAVEGARIDITGDA